MSRTQRIVVLALLGAAAVAASAHAASRSVTNPLNGCTYTVWTPDITIRYIGGYPGVSTSGGVGHTVSCP